MRKPMWRGCPRNQEHNTVYRAKQSGSTPRAAVRRWPIVRSAEAAGTVPKQRLLDQAVYARDSARAGARVLGSALAIGMTIDDVEAWPERISAVTLAQVNAALADVINDRRSVTAILLPEKMPKKGAIK